MTARQFTPKDFTERMERAVAQAADAGLTGLLVTPGPDLVYFTGYQPTAITERITLLVLGAGRDPAMIVPALERGDAERADGVSAVSLTTGPTAPTRTRGPRACSTRTAATPSPTRRGRCTCSPSRRCCPGRDTRR